MAPESIISILISGAALLITIILNIKSSTKDDSAQITTVIVKLENIQQIVMETKQDIKSVKSDVKDIDHRLTIVEQSTKSAHKRIDNLESQLNVSIGRSGRPELN